MLLRRGLRESLRGFASAALFAEALRLRNREASPNRPRPDGVGWSLRLSAPSRLHRRLQREVAAGGVVVVAVERLARGVGEAGGEDRRAVLAGRQGAAGQAGERPRRRTVR